MRVCRVGHERRRSRDGGGVVRKSGWVGQSQLGSLWGSVFKILWLLTGFGACEPRRSYDPHATMLLRTKQR
jgi:hypothetical protein